MRFACQQCHRLGYPMVGSLCEDCHREMCMPWPHPATCVGEFLLALGRAMGWAK